MEDLEEVKKKYKLTQEEHYRIGEQIKKIMLYDKYPVENPTAIIDIAPPASGKTGLNGYAVSQFIDNNVVVINSDELKPFHPKVDEIARLYPQYFTKVTDQESNTWTSDLFNTALEQGYNVIFEGTGRTTAILETIKNRMKKYKVIVRGMSVNELNCLISILERYEYQIMTRGWGRLVTTSHFLETYHEMPEVIDKIEKSGLVHKIEIYKRGSVPSEPIKIYDSLDIQTGRFPNAKYAILGGRNEDAKNALSYYDKHMDDLLKLVLKDEVSNEEKQLLSYISEVVSKIKKETKIPDIII